MNTINPVLAQKLGLTVDAPSPQKDVARPTPMRQMRRALGRAAETAANLSSSVLGIVEEDLEADVLIYTGPKGWVVLGLRDGDHPGLTGLFLIDLPLRSALVEMQTMGSL
jgi:flagellar motor switch protein FliM